MADSRERRRYNQGFHRLLTLDLDDHGPQDRNLDDVPQKLTEERIRTEWEQGSSVRKYDSVPLLIEGPAPAAAPHGDQPMATELSRGAVPPATAPADPVLRPAPQNRPAQTGSILRLDEAPAKPAARPSGAWKLSRRPRRSRGLWTAVLVLSLALAGVVAYSYVAFQRNSVDVSALPGAATVHSLRADAASAEQEARPTLSAAAQRVEQAAAAVRGRYEHWRARH